MIDHPRAPPSIDQRRQVLRSNRQRHDQQQGPPPRQRVLRQPRARPPCQAREQQAGVDGHKVARGGRLVHVVAQVGEQHDGELAGGADDASPDERARSRPA